MTKKLVVILMMFLMQSYLQQSFAADNPNQDEIDDYNNKKDLINAQKDLLAAQKSLIDAMYPVIPNLGKEGTITKAATNVDSFHATTQTYTAIQAAASKVCSALEKNAGSNKVLLISEGDGVAIAQFKIINEQLEDFRDNLSEYGKFKRHAEGLMVAPIIGSTLYSLAALGNSITSFSKIFRTDREFSSEDLTVDLLLWESILASECAKKENGKANLLSASILDAYLIRNESNFLKTFNKVIKMKASLENDKSKADIFKDLSPGLSKLIELVSNEATLKKLLRSEYLNSHYDSGTLIATTKVIKATGFNMKTSNIWRSDKLYASGSVVVFYSLADKEGKLTDANLIIEETKLQEIQKTP